MVISLASLATEVPSPIESPTCAALSAGASLVPSPVTATTSPLPCSSDTRRDLSCGRARDITFSRADTLAASSSLRAANSGPEIITEASSASVTMPTCRPISRAVPGVSPVTIFTLMPASIHSLMAAGTSLRTGSLMATMPINVMPCTLSAPLAMGFSSSASIL